jgi:hypothetical protein
VIRRSVQLVRAIIVASIRITILVSVLHRGTHANWRKLTTVASLAVLGLLIAPHLIGHRARHHAPRRATMSHGGRS